MPLTKYERFSYPIHFLKSRGSVIRNNFLEYRTNQATFFARRNDFYALLVTNKAKHIPNRLVSCSLGDTIYSKSIREKSNKVPFLKVFYFSTSQHFPNVKV